MAGLVAAGLVSLDVGEYGDEPGAWDWGLGLDFAPGNPAWVLSPLPRGEMGPLLLWHGGACISRSYNGAQHAPDITTRFQT